MPALEYYWLNCDDAVQHEQRDDEDDAEQGQGRGRVLSGAVGSVVVRVVHGADDAAIVNADADES